MTTFVPSHTPDLQEDIVVTNNGFYPDLSVTDFKTAMDIGSDISLTRAKTCLQAAMIEVNESLKNWRANLPDLNSLDQWPVAADDTYGEINAKVFHYKRAIFNRARAVLIDQMRDYDTTKTGLDKAEQLSETTKLYYRQSHEALARLMDRTRTTVELI
ncbi:head completion/stabilization protein [Terasakiella pusilla]|uniref:head completion/stabilization protein n=1 Tax=Terasakiella pusilla TaxID=64973 RepID=UPI003AA7D1CD